MTQHFVTFYSPGTFVAETTTKPIDTWDVDQAVAMSKGICERYNARPYGFQFSTRTRTNQDLGGKETTRSPMYYLDCAVETLEEIKARQNPKDRILIRNMESNGWDRVVSPRTGWKWVRPLRDGDVVLPVKRRFKL